MGMHAHPACVPRMRGLALRLGLGLGLDGGSRRAGSRWLVRSVVIAAARSGDVRRCQGRPRAQCNRWVDGWVVQRSAVQHLHSRSRQLCR